MTSASVHTPRSDQEAALAAWDEYATGEGFLSTARAQYRSIATRFLNWLEPRGIGVGAISPGMVDEFLDGQAVGPTTRTHYRSMLRRFFDALAARGILDTNPVKTSPRPAELRLTVETLPGLFAASTDVERQATADAAAAALLFHDIYRFSEGRGGRPADVTLCEAVLQLGEEYGITPFSWADGAAECDDREDSPAEQPEDSGDRRSDPSHLNLPDPASESLTASPPPGKDKPTGMRRGCGPINDPHEQ